MSAKFKAGDLIMDHDPDWPDCNDLALVLHAAHANNGQSRYTLYWCTGECSGEYDIEDELAIKDFKIASKGRQN